MNSAISAQDYLVKSISSWKGWEVYPLRDYIRFKKNEWNKWYSGIAHPVADNGVITIDVDRLYHAKTNRVFFADMKRSMLFWCERSDLQKFIAKGGRAIDTLGQLPKFIRKSIGWRETIVESSVSSVSSDAEPTATSIDRTVEDTTQVSVAMKKTKKAINSIWVTFEKEGIHKYPAALTDPKLATGGWDDVSFLGYPHRHTFKFKVTIEVFHDDRDIEFIQFKRWLERLYNDGTLQLDYRSCEMISDDLADKISEKHPGRKIVIEVSEDGENGSYAVYVPE